MPAKCDFCGIELDSQKKLKHQWDEHREEMLKISGRGGKKKAGGEHPSDKGDAQEKLEVDAITEPAPATINAPPHKEDQIKGRVITKIIDLPGEILVFYWLAKAAFPEYDATEGEWITDCVRQFYAEHSEELGLSKLFDKTYKVVPVGAADDVKQE